jgi:hypothetical protein
MHWDFLLPKLTYSPRSGEVVSYVLHEYMRFTKYRRSSLIEENGFEIKSISVCGGVYGLMGHERRVQRKLLILALCHKRHAQPDVRRCLQVSQWNI